MAYLPAPPPSPNNPPKKTPPKKPYNWRSDPKWNPNAQGPPVPPKTTPKTTPGKNKNRDALIAKYLAGLQNPGGANSGQLPDLSGYIPGAPDQRGYMGPTVPDYGQAVGNAEFPAFQGGRATSVDPKAYSRITGEAYTPLLSQLKQQQAGYQAGLATGNKQIEGAYGSASDLATQARDRILGTGQATAAANNQANAALVASAGNDPIAAAAATQANAANANLSGALSSIDAQGAADSGAAAQRQKAASLLDYGNSVRDKTSAIGTQIGQAQLAQGQDKQKALMDALSFNDQMSTSRLNRDVTSQSAQLAARLAGGEITAQDLQNAGTRAGLSKTAIDSLMGKQSFNNDVLQNKFNNIITSVNSVAQLKALAKQTTDAGGELDYTKMPAASAASVDSTSYGNIEEQLIKPNLGADGASLVNPRKLYDQTFRALNEMDKKTPKAVKAQLAKRLVQSTVNTFNTKNSDAGSWYWDGNTFSQRKKTK